MNEKVILRIPAPIPLLEAVTLEAEPEPLPIDLQRTAVIVVDMQNCFLSKGGVFEFWGRDISSCQKIIPVIKRVNAAARAKGCKVIYIAHTLSPDMSDSSGPSFPYWYKEELTTYRNYPELRDKLTIRGTWGSEIVDELKPQDGDLYVEKPRYSAFYGTNLDAILKTYNIKYLVFVGVATNICVESSLRDAFHLGYFCILTSDATMNEGPPFTQEATIIGVKYCFGWVTTSENIVKAMKQPEESENSE